METGGYPKSTSVQAYPMIKVTYFVFVATQIIKQNIILVDSFSEVMPKLKVSFLKFIQSNKG